MYGSIIGDLAGSIYEYDQIKSIKEVRVKNIIENNAFYSDDTILTIAIMDAILNNGNYSLYLKKYINDFQYYKPDFFPYFKTPFSPSLMKWSKGEIEGVSTGNGAMMRISPVGYLFNNESDIIMNCKLATTPSHNSDEAINCATKVALMIYYFRQGMSKDEVYNKLDLNLEYRPFSKFNTTCNETFGNCLYAIYYGNSFDDIIRKTILMGGDTDTNAAITGGVAEAIYGVSDEYIKLVDQKLPKQFVKVLKQGKKVIKQK